MISAALFESVARPVRIPIECELSAAQVLLALRDEPWAFALSGAWAGGGSIVGARPAAVASKHDEPLDLIDMLPEVDAQDLGIDRGFVGGGWFGWLGYGLAKRIEHLPVGPPRRIALPDFQLAYYDHVLHQDQEGRWWFEALRTAGRGDVLELRAERLQRRLRRRPPRPPRPDPPPPFSVVESKSGDHLGAVRECGERIAAGEIFQANICLRLETVWTGDPAELFAVGSPRLQPAYGAAFSAPWGGITSFSPELFLRRRGRVVTTRPIKGTVVREADAARAATALSRLRGSIKDHAEHVMIVDLMRNDLGRVCEYGTIEATSVPDAEAHPGVWHLASRVQGSLRGGVTDGDLLRATFPAGSVTGAPKIQAMRVIAELEDTTRELYTGAIGFASPLAGLELSVAIRTFEMCQGRLWLGAGGAIVADSDPCEELAECFTKARPLLDAIGSSIGCGDALETRPSAVQHLRL